MDISPLSRKLNPAEVPLDRLASSSQLAESEKIAGVGRHFEAILLRQFLTEAQKPLMKSKMSLLGASNDIYQDMIVNQLADSISKSGTLGLANSFQAQMTHAHSVEGKQGDRDAPTQ